MPQLSPRPINERCRPSESILVYRHGHLHLDVCALPNLSPYPFTDVFVRIQMSLLLYIHTKTRTFLPTLSRSRLTASTPGQRHSRPPLQSLPLASRPQFQHRMPRLSTSHHFTINVTFFYLPNFQHLRNRRCLDYPPIRSNLPICSGRLFIVVRLMCQPWDQCRASRIQIW